MTGRRTASPASPHVAPGVAAVVAAVVARQRSAVEQRVDGSII
jgi:hypothetical protein